MMMMMMIAINKLHRNHTHTHPARQTHTFENTFQFNHLINIIIGNQNRQTVVPNMNSLDKFFILNSFHIVKIIKLKMHQFLNLE